MCFTEKIPIIYVIHRKFSTHQCENEILCVNCFVIIDFVEVLNIISGDSTREIFVFEREKYTTD